jgi:hypothetical protein
MTYKYPNVDLSYPGLYDPYSERQTVVPPFMAQLVDAVAVKYPHWVVRGIRTRNRTTALEVDTFSVLDDSNPRKILGNIGVTSRFNKNNGIEAVFFVTCHRLEVARNRGSELKTKDLKVVMKALKEFFEPPPVSEQLDDVYEEARDVIAATTRQYKGAVEAARETTFPLMQQYARSNWEHFVDTLEPTDARVIQDLVIKEDALGAISHALSKFKSDEMLTVLTTDDKYVVRYKERVSAWDSDELPAEVRRRIGMLKLTDVHVVLEGVGVKVRNNGFVIMPPPEGFGFDVKESSDAVPKL